jgi:hypothetical protein
MTSHMLLCQGEGADSEWKDRIPHLGLWLSEVDMNPLIHQCLINSLSQQMDTTTFVLNADPLCMNAAMDQNEIGWKNFVEGKIAKQWGCFNWSTTGHNSPTGRLTGGPLG